MNNEFFKHREVRFARFLSGGFTTMAVLNPPERKLAKRTSVQWGEGTYFSFYCTLFCSFIGTSKLAVKFTCFEFTCQMYCEDADMH